MKDFLKKHNIKRVNIYWFVLSLAFSAIFALILSLISKKWCNFVPDALSLTALPSLFISCLVLTNIDDVRKQIKSEEECSILQEKFDKTLNRLTTIDLEKEEVKKQKILIDSRNKEFGECIR